MEKKFDVICAGQCVIDCITRGKELKPYRKDVYRAENIILNLGGDASNEARALAAMGYRVSIVCGLGHDLAGDVILQQLEKKGVDTSRVTRTECPTPIADIQVATDGSRLSINSGATRLSGYVIRPEDAAGARVLSLASMFRPPLEDPETVFRMVKAAKDSGSVICADTKLALSEAVRTENYRDVLALIDYFFPNEKEAAYYSGEDSFPRMAAVFRDMGIRNVVIKAGADGCFASGEEGEFSLPAVPVNVVDTTGAGDSFVSGFISGILEGASFMDCARLALKRAAENITHIGT